MTTNSDNRESGKHTAGKILVAITGPTGSGKTALAIDVARHFGCPVVSADSRQVYRGMAIGTAQPTPEETATVRHYLVACRDITEDYTAGQYEKDALELLGELFRTHGVVVVCGGSGLYLDALCHGMDNLPESDPGLRDSLERMLENEGAGKLLELLRELDPEYYGQVDRQNMQRVMRAVEVCMQTGRPYSAQRTGGKAVRDFEVIKIATELPRGVLYDRINRRVDAMMEAGLEKEARGLYPHRELNSLQTVGYRELFAYFGGEYGLGRAVELIKRNSRRYAKRQVTWLRRDPGAVWLNPADSRAVITYIEEKISNFKQ